MSFQPLEHDIEDQSTPADRWRFTVAVAGLGLGLGIHRVEEARLVLRRQITSFSALRSEVKMRWILQVSLRWPSCWKPCMVASCKIVAVTTAVC